MTLVCGSFNAAVMTWELTVLNDDLAITLHTIVSHAGVPRGHARPLHIAHN